LGPIAEKGLVQGYLMGLSRPNPWTIFFTRPISIVLIVIIIFSAGWPVYREFKSRLKKGDN